MQYPADTYVRVQVNKCFAEYNKFLIGEGAACKKKVVGGREKSSVEVMMVPIDMGGAHLAPK